MYIHTLVGYCHHFAVAACLVPVVFACGHNVPALGVSPIHTLSTFLTYQYDIRLTLTVIWSYWNKQDQSEAALVRVERVEGHVNEIGMARKEVFDLFYVIEINERIDRSRNSFLLLKLC